jgi:hypothetical protein
MWPLGLLFKDYIISYLGQRKLIDSLSNQIHVFQNLRDVIFSHEVRFRFYISISALDSNHIWFFTIISMYFGFHIHV